MSVLNIKIYGDKILREKAEEVKRINKEINLLIEDMVSTMYLSKGVGLAANQVGVLKRIIVIDVTGGKSGGKDLITLVNPVITEKEGLMEDDEGCLSLPGITANIKRFARVTAAGLDVKGNPVKIIASDLLSRALQHEIDHLDGILFVDRLSFTQKILLQKKLKELKKHK
ncbi:MAG: peptide deformylase [bacterium]